LGEKMENFVCFNSKFLIFSTKKQIFSQRSSFSEHLLLRRPVY
jgi:hypothetical protein